MDNISICYLFYHIKELIKFLLNPDIHYEILDELGPI
jgi:hypothetical protein